MSRLIIGSLFLFLSAQLFAQYEGLLGWSLYPTTAFEYAWLTDTNNPHTSDSWGSTQFFTLGCELTHQEVPDHYNYQFVLSTNLSVGNLKASNRLINTSFFQLELALAPRVFVNPKAKTPFFFSPNLVYQMRFGGLSHESVSYHPHTKVTVRPIDFLIGGKIGVRMENGLLIGLGYNHGLLEGYWSRGTTNKLLNSEVINRHSSRSFELHLTYQGRW